MNPQRNQFLGGLPLGLRPLHLTRTSCIDLGSSARQCVTNGLSNVCPTLGEKTLANVHVNGMLFKVVDTYPVNSEFSVGCGQCQIHPNDWDCFCRHVIDDVIGFRVGAVPCRNWSSHSYSPAKDCGYSHAATGVFFADAYHGD